MHSFCHCANHLANTSRNCLRMCRHLHEIYMSVVAGNTACCSHPSLIHYAHQFADTFNHAGCMYRHALVVCCATGWCAWQCGKPMLQTPWVASLWVCGLPISAFVAVGPEHCVCVQAFTRGMLCNWLVCLTLWQANAANTLGGKSVGVWVPISAFVAVA